MHLRIYLQIHGRIFTDSIKGYLDILNPIVAEMVIGPETCYRIRSCFYANI